MKNKSWKQKAVAVFTGIFIVLLAMTMLTGCGKTGRSAKDDLSGMRERTSSDWSSQML